MDSKSDIPCSIQTYPDLLRLLRTTLIRPPPPPWLKNRDTQRELQAEKLANSDLEQKVALSQKRANQAEKAMGDVLKSSPAQRSIHLIEEQIENERVWTKEMSALQATIEPLQAQLEDAAAQRYSLQVP